VGRKAKGPWEPLNNAVLKHKKRGKYNTKGDIGGGRLSEGIGLRRRPWGVDGKGKWGSAYGSTKGQKTCDRLGGKVGGLKKKAKNSSSGGRILQGMSHYESGNVP